MALYSGQTTQLIQGVSQQHPKDRAEGQIGEQVNCVSDIVQGLRRRPASRVLAALTTGLTTNFTLDEHTAVYAYDRGDGSEKYLTFVDTDGKIKVFDAITGAERTVTSNLAATYLSCDDPKSQLRFHTIADTTYILNTTKNILATTRASASAPLAKVLITVKNVSFGKTYRIKSPTGTTIAAVNTASSVAISADSLDKRTNLSTDALVLALVEGIPNTLFTIAYYLDDGRSWTGKSSWSWSYDKNQIVLTHNSIRWPYNFETYGFTAYDENGNQDMDLISSRVASLDDLPSTAPYGYLVMVTNSEEANGTEGVMKYTDGSWREAASEEGYDQYALNGSSMPHRLVRESDGTFYANVQSWQQRQAGTDNSNPVPSFAGSTGTAIGTYQNRLFITSRENVCMSRAFDYTNFFAESVFAPSDDDPIDSSSSDNQVTDILHAINYQGSLTLFSNSAQFIHPADVALTPGTYGVSAVTRYNVSPAVQPIVTGSSVVFPTEFGEFTHMWEFDTNTISGNPKCEENTKHVSTYIKGTPVQVIGNTNTDYVFVRTTDDPTAIYIMQSYFKDEKRAQLAWHRWDFENCDNIVNISLLQQTLYLVCERGTEITLETVDLSLPLTTDSNFELFLDHYYTEEVTAGSYSVGGNDYNARITLAEDDIETFIEGIGGPNEGFPILDYTIDSGYVYMNRDAGTNVIMGYPFESYGTLTSPYIRDSNGRPYTKRTIIDAITLNLQDSGFCSFCIKHNAGVDHTQDFTGIVLNNWQYKIGVATLLDADFYIPVRDYRELIEICYSSDHHLGFSLMSMEWTARMQTRGRRSQ
jgi:hypothetical protein